MKTFKQLLSEINHVIEKKYNINDDKGLAELNRHLDAILSTDISDPMNGLHKAKKILSMYGIQVSHPDISNDSGRLELPVSVFQTHDEFEGLESKPTHKVIYNYSVKDGKFKASAEVKKV